MTDWTEISKKQYDEFGKTPPAKTKSIIPKDEYAEYSKDFNKEIKEGVAESEKRIKDLENSVSIALELQDKYQRENVALKKRAQEAEGEVTIVKGIGQNSPEMKDAQKKIKKLEEDIAILTKSFQIERETHQADMKSKDMEIGRLMSKINLK